MMITKINYVFSRVGFFFIKLAEMGVEKNDFFLVVIEDAPVAGNFNHEDEKLQKIGRVNCC